MSVIVVEINWEHPPHFASSAGKINGATRFIAAAGASPGTLECWAFWSRYRGTPACADPGLVFDGICQHGLLRTSAAFVTRAAPCGGEMGVSFPAPESALPPDGVCWLISRGHAWWTNHFGALAEFGYSRGTALGLYYAVGLMPAASEQEIKRCRDAARAGREA